MAHTQSTRDRLRPRPWHADYVQLRALRAQIASRIAQRWAWGTRISVLDVGCSDRPYEPLFAGIAERYTGVDVAAGARIDTVASADALPFDDESFDCVLCTQVLQYTRDPQRSVAEMFRILKPRGALFLSTHGVAFVDRGKTDRWRWTQHGLRDVLDRAGNWAGIEILPAGGVLCAAGYLVGGQAEAAMHRVGAAPFAAPVCFGLNAAAWNGDRLVRQLFPRLPPDASVNYLAVADRSAV